MSPEQAPRGHALRRLELAERQAERVKDYLERRPLAAGAGVALLYLAWTAVLASQKLLWNDELYTYYIAMLPNPADIWRALLTGAEQIPPTFHLLSRGMLKALGDSPVSLRLPEVLGFLIMMLCLFRFMAFRTSAFYGLIAMLFPLVTGAYRYAYEARPYGVLLGLSGVALASWQAAFEGGHRKLWLALMSLSLAAGVASHYYGVLVVAALAIGELMRSRSREGVDVWKWIAFGLPILVPLLLFGPLLLRSMSYADIFWGKLSASQLPLFYLAMLAPARTAVAATLFVAIVYAMFAHPPSHGSFRRPLPRHELAAVSALAGLPVIAYGLGVLATNTFVNRYALPAIVGLSVLAACGVYVLPRSRAVIGTTFITVMLGSFALTRYNDLRRAVEERDFRLATIARLEERTDPALPIVASEPQIFMTLAYYAPATITNRLVYLSDIEASLRRLGHNSVDRGMADLVGPWFHLPVEPYDTYVAAHPRFWIYGDLGWLNWLTDELVADGRRVELHDRMRDEYLLLASRPAVGSRPDGRAPAATGAPADSTPRIASPPSK